MLRYDLIAAQALSANTTSNAVNPKLWRDQYGAFVVTHSGAKLTSTDTGRIMLQGSFDGTTWFNVDTCAPDDAEYVKATALVDASFSWCKIVQLFPFMRAQFSIGNIPTGRTWNVFLAE